MNNLTFGIDGPIMEGTWYNPQTGDSFTVRNSFFEDNQYIVQTTDGRILKYDQIQNYIKSDKPIEMPKQQVSTNLPREVADLIEDYEADSIESMRVNSLGSLTAPHEPEATHFVSESQIMAKVNKSVSTNYDIISKALTKRSLPDFQVGINWEACPLKEMNMLMELMDVEESEIVDWYLNQVDLEGTTYMIKEVLKDFISKQLHQIPVEPVIEEPIVAVPSQVLQEEPKKAAVKKTKTTKKK
jgi:hypothetical protein